MYKSLYFRLICLVVAFVSIIPVFGLVFNRMLLVFSTAKLVLDQFSLLRLKFTTYYGQTTAEIRPKLALYCQTLAFFLNGLKIDQN
jgi:hypothetical protein